MKKLEIKIETSITLEVDKCPWCQSENVEWAYDCSDNIYIYCCGCQCRGPIGKDANEAIKKWNKRN